MLQNKFKSTRKVVTFDRSYSRAVQAEHVTIMGLSTSVTLA